jgi:hypothetical protein
MEAPVAAETESGHELRIDTSTGIITNLTLNKKHTGNPFAFAAGSQAAENSNLETKNDYNLSTILAGVIWNWRFIHRTGCVSYDEID